MAAWNSKINASIGVTPFEAAHGLPYRSPCAAFTDAPVPNAQPPSKSQLRVLQESATAFYREAIANQAWHRQRRADKLNAGGTLRDFKVGDKVRLYIPPTAAEATRRGRKVKHMCYFRGPMTVTKKVGNTGYTVTDDVTGKQYERTLMNIAPWSTDEDDEHDNGPQAEPTTLVPENMPATRPTSAIPPASTDAFAVGEVIAVRVREPGRDNFEIHMVTDVTDAVVKTRIYGTFSHSVANARFRPLFYNAQDMKCVRPPPGITKENSAYTDTLFAEDLPRDVYARGLKLLTPTAAGAKLDSKSRNVLNSLGGTSVLLSMDNNSIQQ